MDSAIYDHSPWLVSEDRFTTVKDIISVQTLLQGARESNAFLTLFDNALNLHFKSVLIRINADNFQIDKPIEWNGKNKEFQIFFQDSAKCWNMIKAGYLDEGLYDITVRIPDTIYRLRSRQASRIETAVEATASFVVNKGSHTDLQIINLSRSGMLVCGKPQEHPLTLDSVINDITISMAEQKFNMTSTHIDQGRIVRAFQRRDSKDVCHAISFTRDDQTDLLVINGLLPKD